MKAKIIIGGFGSFLAGGFLYEQFKQAWMICGGCLAFIVPFALFVLPEFFPTVKSRRQAEADLIQIEKEIGLRPYTREELRQMEAEERANYNKHARGGALWAGPGAVYTDYDGMLRDAESNQPIQWIGNTATGKVRK